MKRTVFLLLSFLFSFAAIPHVFAQELAEEEQPQIETVPSSNFGLALGLKANTTGFGGEVIAQVHPRIHLRLGMTYFNYNIDMKPYEEFVKGTGTVKTGAVNLLANFHFGRVFFLSAGGIYNLMDVNINGVSAKSVYVGSIEVQPEDVGNVDLSIKPAWKVAPYAGLGIGRAISKDHIVSFAFELGASYFNTMKADLKTTGMLKPTSSAEQVDRLNENLSWINLYPIMSFQLSFRIL